MGFSSNMCATAHRRWGGPSPSTSPLRERPLDAIQREAIARKREDALQRRVSCATRKTPVRFEVAQSLPEGGRVKLSTFQALCKLQFLDKKDRLVDSCHVPQEVVGRVRARWGPMTPARVVAEAPGRFTVEV